MIAIQEFDKFQLTRFDFDIWGLISPILFWGLSNPAGLGNPTLYWENMEKDVGLVGLMGLGELACGDFGCPSTAMSMAPA